MDKEFVDIGGCIFVKMESDITNSTKTCVRNDMIRQRKDGVIILPNNCQALIIPKYNIDARF